MKIISLLFLVLIIHCQLTFSQTYPIYGNEIPVTITGWTSDAMEPFISLDGNSLYFNSLNSADTTNLYYATKVNDSTFNYIGLVAGTYDTSANHLDAVPSIDSLSNFFWTSLRDFPTVQETIHRGVYSAGSVNNISKVYGNFNIISPGWLVFDAAISYQGLELYYANAFFNNCAFGAPCIAVLGVAQKVNDSTFNKLPNSDIIFSTINDTSYITYAPQVTKDGLEIYFTRLLKNTTNTEICVSVRNTTGANFSLPMLIHSNPGLTPEAASPSTDKQKIYYHQRNATGTFNIYLRYRMTTTQINEGINNQNIIVYPNPTNNTFKITQPTSNEKFNVEIYSGLGQLILKTSNNTEFDISNFPSGIYLLILRQNDNIWTTKIQKNN